MIWNRIRGEFIDVIEWLDESHDTMVYRFERYGNEIKFGAQLTVRESQAAVFINEGQLADVFQPGRYKLETQNLPVLSTLQGWKYGFESPFKAEVYFISTKRFTDLKWGTKNPIMLRDPEFGPVRIRAFGTYVMRIKDPVTFIREICGTDGQFTTDEITSQLRNLVVSRFSSVVGEAKIPVLDMAANYEDFANFVTGKIGPEFEAYGLELTKLLIENISLPPAVEEALDKRTQMGVIGDLNRYTQFQAADAIQTAAANPGGLAGAGVGMGVGLGMGQQMAGAMAGPWGQQGQAPQQQSAPAAPPPLPQAVQFFAAIGGQQAGPFDMGALQAKVRSGEINRDTLVWKDGMAGWTAAGQVGELSALFGAVPPPLPPG
ncbi:MAG: SPFH domain-containing protein [Rhodospirillaceae bacterium]|nr:SPFH domain-containing protein [Rhodospirillaceae bacterium]